MPKVIPLEVVHQIKFAVLGHPTHPMSIKAAAAHFNVDRNTIRKILRRPLTVKVEKKRQVPRKVAARRMMVKTLAAAAKILGGRKTPAYPTAASIAKRLQLEHGIRVSYKTVQRDAEAVKLRVYVRPKRAEAGSNPDVQKRRLAFARSCKHRYSRLIRGVPFSQMFVFSDEHVSTANDHSCRIMNAMKRADVLPRERKAKHNTSNVQLWAAIGFNFKSKLIFIDANADEDGRTKRLNAEKYIRRCLGQSGVMPHLQKRRSIFMQDGARCHHANIVKYYLARKNVLCIDDWPAHSPDLNPIEELWGYLERCRSEQFGPARDVGELKKQLRAVWDSIDQAMLNNYVASFEAKLKRVRHQ
jgi:transposase